MTIMTQSIGDGHARRCDGSCHKAHGAKCSCICGGRYHGKGEQAQELLTRDWLGETWRETKAIIESAGGRLEAVICNATRRTNT